MTFFALSFFILLQLNTLKGRSFPSSTQSTALKTRAWVVYRLGVFFGSVGHKVKIHKITQVELAKNRVILR